MTRGRWLAILSLAMAACATSRPAPAAEQLVLSIQNLVCSDCGRELEAAALKVSGVRAATFDAPSCELRLEVAPHTAPEPIVAAVTAEPVDGKPITATVGAGRGAYAPFKEPEPGWDVQQLSAHGEDVEDLKASLAPGKVTVVDFYADWCGPCHTLDEKLHERLRENPRLAYRRINVVDWESKVAQHYLRDAKELPYVLVFDGTGRELARVSGLDTQALDDAIAKGLR